MQPKTVNDYGRCTMDSVLEKLTWLNRFFMGYKSIIIKANA